MMAPLLETRTSNAITSPNRDLERPSESNLSPLPPETGLSQSALDPDVLSIIIIRLRDDLARTVQERDDSLSTLRHANEKNSILDAKVGDLTEHLAQAQAQQASAEQALASTRLALQESDAQVHSLRAIVEDSRRGVLRLQAENRRKSAQIAPTRPLPLDLSQHRGSSAPTVTQPLASTQLGSSPPSTATFFRPLSVLAHRRASSLSDSNVHRTSDEFQVSRTSDEAKKPLTPGGKRSPQAQTFPYQQSSGGVALEEQVDALKTELERVQAVLEKTSKELQEANDSREASEACATALRDFISQHAIGEAKSQQSVETSVYGVKLPPLPSDAVSEQTSQLVQPVKKSNSWGPLKLWKEPNPSPQTNDMQSAPRPPSSTLPLAQMMSSWKWSTSSSTPIGCAPQSVETASQEGRAPSVTVAEPSSFGGAELRPTLTPTSSPPFNPAPVFSAQSSMRTPSLTNSGSSETSSPSQKPL